MDACSLFKLTEYNFMAGFPKWLPDTDIERDGEERRMYWPMDTEVCGSDAPGTILLERELRKL